MADNRINLARMFLGYDGGYSVRKLKKFYFQDMDGELNEEGEIEREGDIIEGEEGATSDGETAGASNTEEDQEKDSTEAAVPLQAAETLQASDGTESSSELAQELAEGNDN